MGLSLQGELDVHLLQLAVVQHFQAHYRAMGKIAPPEGTKMNYESTSEKTKRVSTQSHRSTPTVELKQLCAHSFGAKCESIFFVFLVNRSFNSINIALVQSGSDTRFQSCVFFNAGGWRGGGRGLPFYLHLNRRFGP